MICCILEPGGIRKMLDDEERVRRAADREGRRTRRRQIRERMEISNAHMDGMSSDDEIHQDHDFQQHQSALGIFVIIFFLRPTHLQCDHYFALQN